MVSNYVLHEWIKKQEGHIYQDPVVGWNLER